MPPSTDQHLTRIAEVLAVLAQPNHLRIMLLLATRGPLNVSTICEWLGIEPVSIGISLIKMKDKGIVVSQRKGREVHYSLSDPAWAQILELLFV